jgi:protein-tyrosine phosphatase
MIDVHTHLLPGVDDGSPSVEVSVPVLERFAADGVEIVVCTPHLDASRAGSAPYEHHLEILSELRRHASARPELRLGWEIMLDAPGVDLRDPRLSLGGSSAVLVEFPRMMVPPRAADELFRLRMSGVVPVLAHPERYWGCTVEQVEEWRRVGAVIQMDAAGLLGSDRTAALAAQLLEGGLVDFLASDTHGDTRALLPARRWFEELGAPEHAELLTRTNAARLLANEPMLPVPPLERRRGMLGRLKELLLGRRASE